MPPEPLISVILPVRNEALVLPSLLESLTLQNYPSHAFEIIVADGQSTDGTRDLVRSFAAESAVRVSLVDNPGIRSSAGRNAGVAASRGDFIIFIDGHCKLPSRNLLRDSVALFEQTQAHCLCRPQPLLAPPASWLGTVVAAVRASTLGHGRDSLIYDMTTAGFVDPASSGASYRRTVFNAIGCYDERFDACEDVEFNTRLRKAGMQAYTDPRLAVHYEPRSSLRALLRQMIRYGRGRIRLMSKHRDAISAAQLAPAVLLAWIVTVVISWLVPAPGWMRLALAAPVLLYCLILAAASVALGRKHGVRFFLPSFAIYNTIYLGLGAGLWIETFSAIRSLLVGKSSGGQHVTECQPGQQRG